MIRHYLLFIKRICLHPHEVINIVEAGRHDAIIIGHVRELRARDLGHEGAGFGGIVGLADSVG